MAQTKSPRFDLVMDKGCSFIHTFNWYGNGPYHGRIEDIYFGFPTRIMSRGHGLPTETPTPIFLEGIQGSASVLNTNESGLYEAEYLDEDWFAVAINTVDKEWENNSGVLTYQQPTIGANWLFEMELLKKWHDRTRIALLSSATGEIIPGGDDGAININVPFTVTENWDFSRCYWRLTATAGEIRVNCAYGTLTQVMGDPV
jgi:hypothetical protein